MSNYCDFGHETNEETRLVPLGGGGNIICCWRHKNDQCNQWQAENMRAHRAPNDGIPAWSDCKVYAEAVAKHGIPDFRKGGTQVVEYAGEVHTIVYAGQCVVCRTRVYDGLNSSYLDHDNCALVASEYGKLGPDVPLCFNCSNEERRYTRGLEWARKWRWIEVRAEVAA